MLSANTRLLKGCVCPQHIKGAVLYSTGPTQLPLLVVALFLATLALSSVLLYVLHPSWLLSFGRRHPKRGGDHNNASLLRSCVWEAF